MASNNNSSSGLHRHVVQHHAAAPAPAGQHHANECTPFVVVTASGSSSAADGAAAAAVVVPRKPAVAAAAAGSNSIHSFDSIGRDRYGSRGSYECAVAASVGVYWLFVSLIPVYNKYFFQKSLFPYPIATAGVQLGAVAVLLAAANTVQHFFFHQKKGEAFGMGRTNGIAEGNDNESNGKEQRHYLHGHRAEQSWIFGRHFFWKVKWCVPIGVLFGLKYGVTNWGLHLVPAPTHLLLQATDLVWTILSAAWINGERVTKIELACLAGCIAGSFVLAWQLQDGNTLAAPAFAIFINLLSPMLLGMCIATLRLACCELMRPDNRVGGTVSPVELTSIKLIVSSAVAILLATALERGSGASGAATHKLSWWRSFRLLPSNTKAGVIGGSVLIAVFQVNCTFLTFLTSAVAVGLVGQVKIIPQWIVATIFATRTSKFKLVPMNVLGAALIMASAAAFAIANYQTTTTAEGPCSSRDGHADNKSNEMSESTAAIRGGFGATGGAGGSSTRGVGRSSSIFDSTRSLLLDATAGVGPGRHGSHQNLHLLSDADQWSAAMIRVSYDSVRNVETLINETDDV